MKIKLYFGREDSIKKSGIGKALLHQKQALTLNNIEYTTDKDDLDYDILHINTVFPDSFKLINQARDNQKKVIYHAHSTEEDFRNSFMFSNSVSSIYRKWLIKLYTSADFIITPTPYSKSLLEGYGITVPIQDVSNGVDLDKFNPTDIEIDAFNKKFNIKKEDRVIISVGWLFERKGFDTFVEVAKSLPNYKFFWFGDIKLSNPTSNIKKLLRDLPTNLVLPGYVTGDVFTGAYGRANLFFFPSREETEGIVVLEALACKTQMLLRDIPVFDPWLVDKVSCYKGNNTEDFIRLIPKIVEGELPQTIEGGYKVAQDRNIENIGKQLKKVYETVLEL